MVEPFTAYLTHDVLISNKTVGTVLGVLFLTFGILMPVVWLICDILYTRTKFIVFQKISDRCLSFCTYGIIESIIFSTIRCRRNSVDPDSNQNVFQCEEGRKIGERIISINYSKRLIQRLMVYLLVPFEAFLLSIVFIETCETYSKIVANDLEDKISCSIGSAISLNISAGGFFNPKNAFLPYTEPLNNVSSIDSPSIIIPDDKVIRCVKFFFKWSNIIDTVTNFLQWHQVIAFVIRQFIYLTKQWQHTIGRSTWWSNASKHTRLIILSLLTFIWTTIFILYILIIIAFFKILLLTRTILPLNAFVTLIIPICGFIFPMMNMFTTIHWLIRTIREKECEEEMWENFMSSNLLPFYVLTKQ